MWLNNQNTIRHRITLSKLEWHEEFQNTSFKLRWPVYHFVLQLRIIDQKESKILKKKFVPRKEYLFINMDDSIKWNNVITTPFHYHVSTNKLNNQCI